VSARVVCLSFANEKRQSIEYRLLGHADAWLPLTGRDIVVTNLSSGRYVLEVRARKYQGSWSAVSRFAFAVNAPVWMMWWFWLVTTTCVVSLLYAGYSLQERRARRAAEKLERKVADRTRELAQKTDELESFIYTVSHDLKAPVVSLQGLASLLKLDLAGQLNGDTALYLERIHANTVHMQRLIHDLLALSRIGRIKEARQRVNMAELAADAAHELHGQIELKEATVHVPESLPTVTGERERLKQVWINLIANAIAYARPDVSPVIQIGARAGPENACAFFVRDNGLGVAREYHNKVFEIFYRVNGSYADSESTGVGLAIVRRIVESHGGRAWVESEGLGQGSTFWFTLPHDGEQDVGEDTGMPT
jgi:signal transduction histidine kinase